MGNGPSDEDVRRAQRATQDAKETAKAMAPYVERNRLNPILLKVVLDEFAPGNEAVEDGIYDQWWMDTDTFYRHTEEYVPWAHTRGAFKAELARVFPKKAS